MGKRKDRIREQAEILAKKYDIKYTDDGKYFTIHDKITGKQLTDDDLLDSGEWGILKRKQKLLNKYLESAADVATKNMKSTEGAGNTSNIGSDNNGSGNTNNSNKESGTKKNDDEVSELVSLYEAKLKEQSDKFTKKLKDAEGIISNLSKKVKPTDVFDAANFKWNDFKWNDFKFSNQDANFDEQPNSDQENPFQLDIIDQSIAYNMNEEASLRDLWEDIKYTTGIGMLPLVNSPYVPERSDFEKAKKENKKVIVWGTTVYDVDKSLDKKDIPNWKPVISEEYDYQVPLYNNSTLAGGTIKKKRPIKWYNKISDIVNGTELMSSTSISPTTFKALADIININPEKILALFSKNQVPSINKQVHIISDVEKAANTAGKLGTVRRFNFGNFNPSQYERFLPAVRKTAMPQSGGFLPAVRKKYGGRLIKKNK